jgi:glycosyltransferase involved in cell wall biosynthesis
MSAEARLLRVAIDAHVVSGEYGGVEQVIIGLAHGLSGLSDDGEEYFFLTYEGDQSWLEPYVNGPCSIVTTAPSPIAPQWKRLARSIAPSLAPAWKRLRYGSAAPLLGPPPSAGVAESLGADVFHFPQQQGVLTEIPSVYQPHDLQHLHLGEFFTAEQVAAREAMYRPMCDQASMVSVTSEWGRRDLIEHYGLAEEKVVVIQLAPVLGAYAPPSSETADDLLARHKLPEQFIFYPAQTWPHKNHLRLAEALAILRAEGLDVPLVSVGRLNDHYEEIRARVRELGVMSCRRCTPALPLSSSQACSRRPEGSGPCRRRSWRARPWHVRMSPRCRRKQAMRR